MKKRSLLTSVVASTVLAGVMMMSGCGGSNASTVDPKTGYVIDFVAESKVKQTIKSGSAVEFPVTGKTADGANVETATIKIIKGLDGCSEATPCSVEAVQKGVTILDAATKQKASALSASVPNVTKIPNADVLFAGSLDIKDSNSQVTLGEQDPVGNIAADCIMEVTVKLPAKALGLDGKARNVWDCDIMQIHVTTPTGGYWVQGSLIVKESQGCGVKDKYVTFKVTGGLPAHILIFALTNSDDRQSDAVTGSTGATGAGGY